MSTSLFKTVDDFKERIDQLRPLGPDLEASVQERLRVQWTYNSNALEGNSLTYGETLFFLREGLTSEGKPLKDYLEAKNHAEAIDGLYEILLRQRPLSESLIKELHAVLMQGLTFTLAKNLKGETIRKPFHAGQYKIEPNHVLTLSGKIHRYTDPLHVKDEMEALLLWFKKSKSLHPVERASLFHYKFVAIHPFEDGNGRMARLLMNLILMQEGYPPCIVRNAQRRTYLRALELADETNTTDALTEFLTNELEATLQSVLEVLEGKDSSRERPQESTPLNRPQRHTLILKHFGKDPIAIGQLHAQVSHINRATLKKDLQDLLKSKKIKKIGKGRGMLYCKTI